MITGNLIRVNGYTINAEKVGMLDRKQRIQHLDGGKSETLTGLYLRFTAGGGTWINDPEALEVEAQFAKYAGVQERELPY